MRKQWNFKNLFFPGLFFFLLTSLAFFPLSARGEENPLLKMEKARQKVIARALPSTVAIFVRSKGKVRSHASLLSGIVVDNKGHIVTFGKTFRGKQKLTVMTKDGKKLSAQKVAFDPISRLSLLKVESHQGLQPVKWGDSSQLSRGSLVLTVGHPFGLFFSSAWGQVSGTDRTVEIANHLFPGIIQITAPINPGDIGGLVVNSQGEMVGMMATSYHQYYSDLQMELLKKYLKDVMQNPDKKRHFPRRFAKGPQGGCGIGFVLPSQFIQRAWKQLLKRGAIQWGRLGIKVSHEDDQIEVVKVVPESPAAKGGLKEGDLVLKYEGKKIESLHQFRVQVLYSSPGKKVDLVVLRKGKKVLLHPVIGSMELARKKSSSKKKKEKK